jgi:hypothetical protein
MALAFPPGPTPGQVYVGPNGVSYTWDNSLMAWTASSSGGGGGGGTVTVVEVTGINGIVTSGSPYTTAGAITVDFPINSLLPLP